MVVGRQPKPRGKRGAVARVFLFIWILFGAAAVGKAYDIKDTREVSSRKPVIITSVQLIFDRLKGLTLFKGKVKAVHDHVTLSADEIRAASENREATADGKVRVVDPTAALTMTCGNLEYLDLMNLMTAHDHPLLTSLDENGRPISILGRQMELDSQKKTVVIHQNVQLIHDDGKAEAQKATFLSREDKFILEEEPKLIMGNGELTGRRIVSNLGSNRSVFVEGMADAVFYPAGRPVPKGKNPYTPNPKGMGSENGRPTSPNDLAPKGAEAADVGKPITPTPGVLPPFQGLPVK